MGPIWGRRDPGGPHVGPMNFAIWGITWGHITGISRELFVQQLVHDNANELLISPLLGFVRESTNEQWIPLTKGQ